MEHRETRFINGIERILNSPELRARTGNWAEITDIENINATRATGNTAL